MTPSGRTRTAGTGATAGAVCAGQPEAAVERRARRHRARSRRQAGLGAMDALIGAGIALVALALTVKLGMSAYDSYRINTAASNLNTLTQQVRALYSNTAGYTGLTNAALVNARKVPPQMLDSTGTTIMSPWNTAVTVTGTGANFSVTVVAVPQGACAELAQAVGSGVGLVSVVVNQTTLSLPPDVVSTVTACGNSTNTVTWTFTN